MKTKAEYVAEVIFDEWEREGGITKRRLVDILSREMAAMAPPLPKSKYVGDWKVSYIDGRSKKVETYITDTRDKAMYYAKGIPALGIGYDVWIEGPNGFVQSL